MILPLQAGGPFVCIMYGATKGCKEYSCCDSACSMSRTKRGIGVTPISVTECWSRMYRAMPLEWERGAHSQNHCTAQHTFTMTSQTKITSYGVRLNTSVRTRRAEATPGARTPPPNTTAGQKSPSQDTRIRRPKGKKPTGQLRKEKPIRVMHWNAEGVFHKVEELRNILVEKNIDICCIQKTH